MERNIKNYKYMWLGLIYLTAFLIIFLRPLQAQPEQWADEALYFHNAREIIKHFGMFPWIGPFDQMIISKAPFFPVFLAVIHVLRIPLRVAEFLLYIPLPFLFCRAVKPLKLNHWSIHYFAAVVLLLNPIVGLDSRLVRTCLFGGLALYCLIFLLGILIRASSKSKISFYWVVGAGLTLGLAATTREEAVWLVIPTLVTFSLILITLFRHHLLSKNIYLIPIFICFYLAPSTIFSLLNYASYGIYSPSLRQNKHFIKLYSTLCSLEPEKRHKYVPIITATREKVYQISPTFGQLEPFLEGEASDELASNRNHLILNKWDPNGREFFVSNFEFSFSEAIFLAGYQRGDQFITFCKKSVTEIEAAVADGKITQGRYAFSLLAPIYASDLDDIFFSSLQSFSYLIGFSGKALRRSSTAYNKRGDPKALNKWHDFLKTYPYPKTYFGLKCFKIPKNLFNIWSKLLYGTYLLILLFGCWALWRLYREKNRYFPLMLKMYFIAFSSVAAFCLAVGLVDTIGFAILRFGLRSYIRIGFYSLHFWVLICVFASYFSIRNGVTLMPNFYTNFRQNRGKSSS